MSLRRSNPESGKVDPGRSPTGSLPVIMHGRFFVAPVGTLSTSKRGCAQALVGRAPRWRLQMPQRNVAGLERRMPGAPKADCRYGHVSRRDPGYTGCSATNPGEAARAVKGLVTSCLTEPGMRSRASTRVYA